MRNARKLGVGKTNAITTENTRQWTCMGPMAFAKSAADTGDMTDDEYCTFLFGRKDGEARLGEPMDDSASCDGDRNWDPFGED